MAVTFASRKNAYSALWATAVVKAEHAPEVRAIARRILAGRPRYDVASKATGVPWYVIGIIHNTECGLSFAKHLHNGDPLDRPTVRVPKGRGPFATWEDSAIDALRYDKLDKITDWSIERMAFCFETFNGFGYVPKGIPSPYLWSYTQHYVRGKFVEDGQWSAGAVSKQAGCMAVLRMLIEMEPTQVDVDAVPKAPEPPVGSGVPKAPLPAQPPVAVDAVKSKTGHSILASVLLLVTSTLKPVIDCVGGIFGGAFNTFVDAIGAAMQMLPLVVTDVEQAVAPLKALGGLVGANVAPILTTAGVVFGVVAWARHIKARRERERLLSLQPPIETSQAG